MLTSIQKFKFVKQDEHISPVYTLTELAKHTMDVSDCKAIQCLGFTDHADTEVFQGDILKLEITDNILKTPDILKKLHDAALKKNQKKRKDKKSWAGTPDTP